TKTPRGKARSSANVASAPLQKAGNGLGGIWFMAIMWNAIAFPIAVLAVPQGIASGEWMVLFVLLFPLVGIGLLWAAIAGTGGRPPRGKAVFRLARDSPRVGAPVEGHLEFAHGVRPGQSFNVRLVCERTLRDGE